MTQLRGQTLMGLLDQNLHFFGRALHHQKMLDDRALYHQKMLDDRALHHQKMLDDRALHHQKMLDCRALYHQKMLDCRALCHQKMLHGRALHHQKMLVWPLGRGPENQGPASVAQRRRVLQRNHREGGEVCLHPDRAD